MRGHPAPRQARSGNCCTKPACSMVFWATALVAVILAFILGWIISGSSSGNATDQSLHDLKSYKKRTCLLIIDPQVDFAEGGSLAVPGAREDAERLHDWIKRESGKIDDITVSLDSHQYLHVGNHLFWEDKAGKHPKPFTQITSEDLKNGTWKASKPSLQKHAEKYTADLEKGKRFKVTVWPNHCIMGTPGHAIQPELVPALRRWAKSKRQPIRYVFKGQNPLTEMYSVFKAEVVLGESTYDGAFNQELFDHVSSYDRIVVAGQAKSHCVNYSVRDLLEKLPEAKRKEVYLLNDCTSPVEKFEADAEKFEKFARSQGVQMKTSTKFKLPK